MALRALLRPFIIAVFALLLSHEAWADTREPLVFTGDVLTWEEILPRLEVLRDPTRALSIDAAIARGFKPLDRDVADFGYTKDVIWLRFPLTNTADKDDLVLAFRENFLQLYEVWAQPFGAGPFLIDRQDDTSRFSERQILFPELSTPLSLESGNEAMIYVRFWSGGSSELSWRVMSRDDFSAWSASRTARNFIFYGMTLLFSVAASVSFLVTRRWVFAAYASYTFAGLLFVMHADGNTFQYLWPNAPLFNAFASVPLGVYIIVAGLIFARSFLGTRQYHPRMDRVLVGMMILTCGAGLSTIVVDTQFIKRLLILLSMLTTCLLAIAGAVAARTRFREVRFYLLAWSFAFIASGVMTLRHWLGFEFSDEVQFNAIRIVLLLDAALMGLAILDRINWLRQSQQAALEASLAQANRTMELTRRLQDLEQKMAIAETLAVSQERTLTQTAHDIRQPLNALRLTLRQLAQQTEPDGRLNDAEDTLGYLEALVSENLSDALITDAAATTPRTEIGEVLASVVDMFEADANEKGIRLRHVPTSGTTSVPPLSLMRMVSNLVSNAIKATTRGGVVIGVRRGKRTRIEIHDTGSGLSLQQFHTGQRIDGKSTGMGLEIVSEIAQETGVDVALAQPSEGNGTVIQLILPGNGKKETRGIFEKDDTI